MEVKSKLYYKIGEVCEITGIEAHVLRYWESEFPVLHPLKNSAGQRVYRQKDIELVLRIKQLLYQDGFTIAGAKRRIRESLGHRPRLRVRRRAGRPRRRGRAGCAGRRA